MTTAKTDSRAAGFARLREDFEARQIGVLPKPYKKDSVKGNCRECGGFHGLPAAHLSYVGHAALTDRLLDVDPEWTWEPMALDQFGAPAFDRNGGMWIRLTVLGVTRIGYGDAQGKSGANAVKEAIGDALRNAGMRFGLALTLWHKGDLHEGEQQRNQQDDPATPEAPAQEVPPDPLQMAKDRLFAACRTKNVAPQTVIDWAVTPAGPNGGVALNVCTDPEVFDQLTKRVQDGGFAEPSADEAKAAVQGELGGTEMPS